MSDVTISERYFPRPENAESSYNHLRSEVEKLRLKSRFLTCLNGLLLWFATLLVLMTLWFVFGGILHLPRILRGTLMIIWSICALWSFYVLFFKALIKRLSLDQMAFKIEQHNPEMQDRLISSLQLWREMPENRYEYSENLLRMLVEEARTLFDSIDKSKVLSDSMKKLRRSGLAFVFSLIPIIALILFLPIIFNRSLNAFTHPFQSDQLLVSVEFVKVTPGDVTIQPGEGVDITVEVKGAAPDNAILHFKSEKADWQTINIQRRDSSLIGNTSYSTNLSNMRQSTDYYVSVMNAESSKYKIKVAQKPVVSNVQIDLQYPKYTGITPQTLAPNVGDISAPIGTKAVIKAETNKDVISAFLVFNDNNESTDTRTRMGIQGSRTLNGSFLINQDGTYYVTVLDADGLNNSDPVKYSINAIPDQSPKVNIVNPGKNITLGQDMKILLQVDAQDDYGIANLRLNYQIEGQNKRTIVSLATYNDRQRDISLRYIWDIMPIQLFPEDVISYYVEASDTDNVSGPNVGKSTVYTARFPSLYEVFKQTESEQQNQESEMENILSKQDEAKKAVDDLVKDMKNKSEMDWTNKKDLEKAVEMQKKIEEQMKSVAQKVEETTKKAEQNPLISTDILDKLKELKDLINEIATDEMKQLMKKLSESLDKVNLSEQQKDLMSTSAQQQELMEKLDRIIDLFKNMQMMQKLEVAANQAKELVKQQTETLDKSEQLTKDKNDLQAKSSELSNREMRIKNQFDQLQNDLRQLSDEAKDRVKGISEMIKQISNTADKKQVPGKLQQASKELANQNPYNSMPFQKDALSSLTQMQDDLQSAADMAKGQDAKEILNALRDSVQKSLNISYRHEEITQSASNVKSDAETMLPKEKELIDSLAADQLTLADGVKKIAKNLKDLSHKNSAVNLNLVWNLEKAANGMERASKALEDKLPTVAEPIQRNSLAMINRSIEAMLDSMDQVNSQATPMMSMNDYMDQLRQLADQQSQVNQSTQNAEGQMRKQGSTPSIQDLLEKLAGEQALIKEAAERLAEKMDQMDQKMGNLGQTAKEMEEVEKTLREGDVDRQTIERQKRILTRLLEYEKSMKKDELDKNREAKAGRDLITEKPPTELPPDATKIQKQLDTIFAPSLQEQWPIQYKEQIKMYYKSLSNTLNPKSEIKKSN